MAYQLEADPQLLSSEYWGLDIDDLNSFADEVEAPLLSRVAYRAAARRLVTCLSEVMLDNYIEQSFPARMFDPSHNELNDGSVVVILREQVMKAFLPEDKELKWSDADDNKNSPPLSHPIAAYWRRNQTGQIENFGRETVLFPDGVSRYDRFAEMGVLSTAPSGDRRVKCWDLDEVSVTPDMFTVPVSKPKVNRIVELCPLFIDMPIAIKTTVSPEVTIRMIERITDIRVIRTAENDNDQATFLRLRERITNTANDISSLLLPTPVPIPA